MCLCVGNPAPELPYARFIRLLHGRTFDARCKAIIETRLSSWLSAVADEAGANRLLEAAAKHPFQTTRDRLATNANVRIDDDFAACLSNTHLSRAICLRTGVPLVIKTSDDALREIEAFKRLDLDWGAAIAANIVPLRMAEVGNAADRHVLIMPALACPVDCISNWPLELVQRGISQIAGALTLMHSKGVFHRDVKPGVYASVRMSSA